MALLEQTLRDIKEIDRPSMEKASYRLDSLTKPLGSLGRLEGLAQQIAGITGTVSPELNHKVIFTLAADHGVVEEGVSVYPQEVTAQMVVNFLTGGAAINVLAAHAGARVVVVDIGVAGTIDVPPGKGQNFRERKLARGTANFSKGAAMTRDQAVRAIEIGIALVEEEKAQGLDIIGTGEMGIGNTTASSAIAAACTGLSVASLVGRGAGLADEGLRKKTAVIEKALALNRPDAQDPLDVLAKVGGFEIAGLAGVILGAASKRIPVVIDGFISGAAALIASRLAAKVQGYIIASHCSVEPGHRYILKAMGLTPLFDLGMRLGEGTGAALGIGLAEAAVKIMKEMATFEGARVSKERQ